MSVLGGKKILIGVTAGIAAYKSAWLVRGFIKAGAEVKVIMTPAAKDFVTPLTLATLSKNEVFSSFVNDDDTDNPTWNNHVELGLWADFFVIAPATANTMAKMSTGTCDNLLLATYLSAKCPVYFAPAMDLDMYRHRSTQETFEKLQSYGNIMIPAGHGELASGLEGQGRMAEPEDIVRFIEQHHLSQLPLRQKKILLTAGPTHEAIDPVRFIGNHSSGKMGYAIAERALALGAEVILISGPTHLAMHHSRLTIERVSSAQEMYEAAQLHFKEADILIAAAAVADYRPANTATQKIKKKSEALTLQLESTIDILATLGKQKQNQFLVGFALETENELEHAKAKLVRKNLDMIVLNSLKDKGAGFQTETNKITILHKDGEKINFDLKSKTEVASDILDEVIKKTDV
ncbi:MAG: bifunctional phosphopantothenoylcysteine decarboxylase/phosphopantothenate--cysteine ligase CoaBC [Cytophagaceae bacterium]|nr:bifunctional phosphopantothenoylcysteine decarboxylase/phosphopantothenate--cysteine ligase CoaBC [Cytophagaceae bacterium]